MYEYEVREMKMPTNLSILAGAVQPSSEPAPSELVAPCGSAAEQVTASSDPCSKSKNAKTTPPSDVRAIRGQHPGLLWRSGEPPSATTM